MNLSPNDLALYMGAQSVDEDRARLLLDLAVEACEEIVSPLPDGARGVVLDVAASAFVAPPGPGGQQTAGPYGAPLPPGGVVLSRRQERRLKRLAGRGSGAFTITPGPGRAPQVYGRDYYSGELEDELEREELLP